MPDAVQIAGMRLTPLDREQITRVMAQSANAWYDVTVTVKNHSDTTVYVMSDVRRMHYDGGRRALLLEFAEGDRSETAERISGRPLPPRVTPIAPAEEATVTFRLASPIAFADESPEGGWRPRLIRVPEDVAVIDCAIAYDTTPLPQAVNLASSEPLQEARGWGRDRAVASIAVSDRPDA